MQTPPSPGMPSLRLLAAGLLLLPLAAPAGAQSKQAAGPGDECICRAQGQMWKLGETICLSTPQGPRLAICDMVLNNTSWRQTDQSCPQASAPFSRRRG